NAPIAIGHGVSGAPATCARGGPPVAQGQKLAVETESTNDPWIDWLILQPLSLRAIEKGGGNSRAGSLQNQGLFSSVLVNHKGKSFLTINKDNALCSKMLAKPDPDRHPFYR